MKATHLGGGGSWYKKWWVVSFKVNGQHLWKCWAVLLTFLWKVVYVGVHGLSFEIKSMIVEQVPNIEVLIWNFYHEDEELSGQHSYLIIQRFDPHFNFWKFSQPAIQAQLGYIVSREIFDKLISTCLRAFTDHTQNHNSWKQPPSVAILIMTMVLLPAPQN